MRTIDEVLEDVKGRLKTGYSIEYDRALDLLFDEIVKINKEREEYVDSLIKENNWQDYQLDKLADEKVKIINALEEKIKYSHLSVKGGRANGKSIDYGYKLGLCDTLKIVKEGGAEPQLTSGGCVDCDECPHRDVDVICDISDNDDDCPLVKDRCSEMIEDRLQAIKMIASSGCEDSKDYENIEDFCDEILEELQKEKEKFIEILKSNKVTVFGATDMQHNLMIDMFIKMIEGGVENE